MSSTQPTSLITINTCSSNPNPVQATVLWDTGATQSFLDDKFTANLAGTPLAYPRPFELRLFDGSVAIAGPITHYLDIEIKLHPDHPSIPTRVSLTKLHGADLVLGSNWMTENGVQIDLPTTSVSVLVPSPPCPTVASLQGTVLIAKEPQRSSDSLELLNQLRTSNTMSTRESTILVQGSHTSTIRAIREPIAATGYATVAKTTQVPENQFEEPFTIEEIKQEQEELLLQLPKYYHGYLDIFLEKRGTQTLPPHRSYDMRIDLVPSAKLSIAKLYQLTEAERIELLDTLDRETKAGRIRPSNAAYGSPMFFVPKKDGRYRMVVDYRRLNENTIPDVYPLPLISQILNDLSKAKFYSKLDLVGAYQLLRMAEGYEHLTAFRTQYGMYESLVVRDGLRNAPSVFQHFLNDVFKEVLGRGVAIYIDDILVYANTIDELRQLTLKVFDLIRQSSLFLKATKCELEKQSLAFLGVIISHNGIETDPEKVKAVREFPAPTNLRQSRSFIGLVGYYRRFIPRFSEIAAPITELTKKDQEFRWDEEQQQAFEKLKLLLTSAPVLAHFDPSRETILQTDASHFGWGFILSQINPEDNLEHPIAIESGRFSGAQLNYSTSEKEFLAIVEAFRRSRHMLLLVHTTIITDHLNLTYWMQPRQLTSRQARWKEELGGFQLSITYRPGVYAVMPDALSRRADYHPGKGTANNHDINFTQALPSLTNTPEKFTNIGLSTATLRALQPPTVIDRDYFVSDNDIYQGLLQDEDIQDLRRDMMAIMCHKCDHPTCANHWLIPKNLAYLRQTSRYPGFISPRWDERQFLLFDKRVYVPNYNNARLKILKARHDSPLAGHQGINKTIELVTRDYIWLGINKDIEAYVSGCVVCQRTKVPRQSPYGLLKTLEVPTRPWTNITMDFIEQLPKSDKYDTILVVVDRLTKWSIFIPTDNRISSARLAELLIDRVFSQHGLPNSIVSDRGSTFVSKLWRYITEQLGIDLRLSTAYHPQTDGQTERVNQVLEQYLRIFTTYNQDDWSSLLPHASFAYNNSIHSATKLTPFYANFGYHPRWVDEIDISTESESPKGWAIVQSLIDVHRWCSNNITEVNKDYKKYYDRHRKSENIFEVGNQVMLSMRNIRTTRPTKKLDIRQSGPYTIIKKIGTHACLLDIPTESKIHNVFHVSLLQPYHPPTFPGQKSSPPEPIEAEDGEKEYEVANILDSRRNPRTGKLQYLVEWLGYEGTDEHTGWEPKENLTGTQELIAEFHLKYPKKPRTDGPKPRRRRT